MKNSVKKSVLLLCLAASVLCSCTKEDEKCYDIVTFEDMTHLIDEPEYGGALLYGEPVMGDWGMSYAGVEDYVWVDDYTHLSSRIEEQWGSKVYWNGGCAISDYYGGDLSQGDYTHQLSVYLGGSSMGRHGAGHNASDNFAVLNADNAGFFFEDNKARVIDHMYVNNTLYTVAVLKSGNAACPAISRGEYFKVIAKGYDAEGNLTGESQFLLADGPDKIVTEWTKWNLTALGAPLRVSFSFEANGALVGEWGVNVPLYFAFDDVAVLRSLNVE